MKPISFPGVLVLGLLGTSACDRAEQASSTAGVEAEVRARVEASDALLKRLNAIEGVEATALAPSPDAPPGVLDVALTIDQPVDHDNPGGEHFRQRLTLRHRGEDRPTVLLLAGYGIGSGTKAFDGDVSSLLGANTLLVEHRFFGPSTPDSRDWRYLTIEQDAADSHHIIEALRPIYDQAWLSEGGSKGGMGALYHRRFYPNDVAGTIAYAAPQSYGVDDPRYAAFLEHVGDADCRQRLVDAQRAALTRRDELLLEMSDFADFFDLTYDALSMGVAFEHTIIESRFYFWQYGSAAECANIPAADAPAFDLFVFFLQVANLGAYLSDQRLAQFEGFYYQAATQLGYYGPSLAFRLGDLLEYPGTFLQSSYPPDTAKPFDFWAMPDIQIWLATRAERVMLIYGENDPTTAGAFFLGHARDSFKFINAGANHITGFADMSATDRSAALGALEAWSGVKPDSGSATLRADGARSVAAQRDWYSARALRPLPRPPPEAARRAAGGTRRARLGAANLDAGLLRQGPRNVIRIDNQGGIGASTPASLV